MKWGTRGESWQCAGISAVVQLYGPTSTSEGASLGLGPFGGNLGDAVSRHSSLTKLPL